MPPFRKFGRSALTLVEIVVVIAIVALIVALALPAIQHARTASIRVDCKNRLRQIGIALQNYASDYGGFPPRSISLPGVILPPGPWNEHVCLLPYLEQTNVYNALNHGLFWQLPANSTVGKMSLRAYLCPADANPQGGDYGIGDYGFGNYAACIGSGLWPLGPDATVDAKQPYDGLFFGLIGVKMSDCTDGLTHTAAFSEIVHGGTLVGFVTGPANTRKLPDPPVPGFEYTFGPFSPPTQRKLIEMCSNLGPNHPLLAPDLAGTPWLLNLTYNHLLTPNQPRCVGPGFGDSFSAMTASSRHGGVVHVVFGDGHVSPITNSIDLQVWRALGSRNGGEIIDQRF